MKPGDLMCFRTTGELVVVLQEFPREGQWTIRRPRMTENGIKQEIMYVYAYELETTETHLRREAQEMVLKVKIQNEIQKQLAEMEKDKLAVELVN